MKPEPDRAVLPEFNRWQNPAADSAGDPLKEIFADASDLSSADREALLRDRCGENVELRRAVESLLKAHDEAGSFFADATQAMPVHDTLVGQRIGRYKLLQPIGEGGFGTVYMAEQESPVRRRVALKVIKLGMDTKLVIARFEAERQALALMDHPNIAKVFDAGSTDSGRPFFVMELVNGVPVTAYCDANRLTARERLELFVPICQAVQHAHQKGIIHRDLKPTNVLVTLHDGRPTPKVIDFGIAKATQARLTEKTLFTEFHQMIGTPQYMSPEQAEMSGLDIDTRTDLYSLGVLLYELLTGTTPLDPNELRSKAYAEMQRIIREDEPPNPSQRLSTMGQMLPAVTAHRRTDARQLGRLIRGDLDWIVMKCLEKDRARRYDSASGLAADVLRYLANEPVSAAKPSTTYRVQKYVRRHRTQVAMVLTVVCLLVGGIAASTVGLLRAMRAERIVLQKNAALAEERDRVVAAEALAQQQKLKAETAKLHAEAEARRARQQSAESRISDGDAQTTAGEFRTAYERYDTAKAELDSLGSSLARLDLSLARLYRASPPPLWTARIPGGLPRAWVVLPTRSELLVAGDDKSFHTFDLLAGGILRSFGDTHGVQCMAAAQGSDGPVVVVGSLQFMHIIDPATGDVLREANDDRAMRVCALSPDGSLAASVDQGGSIVFWETATLNRMAEGRHGKLPRHLAFSHDGSMVASVCDEDTVAIWEPRTGRQIRSFPENPNRWKNVHGCSCVEFSSDDKSVHCGEPAGVIATLSVDGAAQSVRTSHGATIESIVATPEGKRVISSAADGAVQVIEPDLAGEKPTLTLVSPSGQRLSMRFVAGTGPAPSEGTRGLSPADQGVVVAIDQLGKVMAWPLVAPHRPEGKLGGNLVVSRDGLLVAGHSSRNREVRDAATGRTLRVIRQDGYSHGIAFSPDSRHIYIGEQNLAAFDLVRNRCEWCVNAHQERGGHRGLWWIDVSADGALLASGGEDGAARVWDARTGTLLAALGGHGPSIAVLAFAPDISPTAAPFGNSVSLLDGRRLIVGPGDGAFISEWDLGTNRSRRVSGFRSLRGLTFSPDGQLLAVADSSRRISLLDAQTLRTVALLGPIQTIAYAFQFSDPGDGPGKWAISRGRRDLRVWDLAAQEEKFVFERAEGPIVASPDGSLIWVGDCGRIDLNVPRRLRELARGSAPLKRAEFYARFGLWAWAKALIDRERAAGRDVPALLAARAYWMCGDVGAARQFFARAVARQEVPAGYADMCLSAGDAPPAIDLIPATERPPDPGAQTVADESLLPGVLPAADVDALRNLIGQEVTVEGIVSESLWSGQGKHLCIQFSGTGDAKYGLVCDVARKHRKAFDAAFSDDAASAFNGARLRVHGKVTRYRGKRVELAGWPELILDDPAQVTIVK